MRIVSFLSLTVFLDSQSRVMTDLLGTAETNKNWLTQLRDLLFLCTKKSGGRWFLILVLETHDFWS